VGKTALLQPDFFIGFANVLLLARGRCYPNAPIGRKAGGKKIKALAVMFAYVEPIFVMFCFFFIR
jgi:hypothetical protein